MGYRVQAAGLREKRQNRYVGEPEVWEMQVSSINENIPEDATLAVLEHPNLRRQPVGACVFLVWSVCGGKVIPTL